MAIERVCIIGAGTIGSLYAGHLAEVAEVLVLTRRPGHAQALNEHGLRVTGKGERHARVKAATDPGELPEFDLGIVATNAMNCRAVSRGETAGSKYAHLPSMLEDALGRRTTEVDAISGALVSEGARLGVPVPLNAAIWRLVRGKQRSWGLGAPAGHEEVRV